MQVPFDVFIIVTSFLIFCIKTSSGSPFYPLQPEDLIDGDIKEIEYYDKYYPPHRSKRTIIQPLLGSAGAAIQLKSALVSGTKMKIIQIAQTAAFSSADASKNLLKQGAKVAIGGSISGVNQLKTALSAEIKKKIAHIAKSSLGASANILKGVAGGAVHTVFSASQTATDSLGSLKAVLLNGVNNQITKLASGSASVASSASAGINAKVQQVSKDIAIGGADVADQLKSAIVAGTKKKLAKAASGFAGAATAAVGSASAGLGQLTRGIVNESVNLVEKIKEAILNELQKKLSAFLRSSVSLTGEIGKNSAKIASASTANAANAIKRQIGNIAQGSLAGSSNIASSAAKSSVNAAQKTGSALVGSAKAIHQIKAGIATKLAEELDKKVSEIAEASSAEVKKRSVQWDSAEHLNQFDKDLPKRSETPWSTAPAESSGDIISDLKSSLFKGLTQKLGQVAKGSAGAAAGASAGFSKGSSGGGGKEHHHHYEHVADGHEEHKIIDAWDVKKSVLNTLLQAVKAIKGGVLAIKGQLIKGSGYVVSGGGKLIAASGDQVTKLGKNILHNVLVHPDKEHHYVHEYDGPPHHHSISYSAPSGPSTIYGPPIISSSSSGHGFESHYESPHHQPIISEKYQHGNKPAGIVILRKIPPASSSAHHAEKYHTAHSEIIPSFKPLAPSGPSFGTVAGKFFTASTSLNPADSTHFSDTEIHPNQHQHYSSSTLIKVENEADGRLEPPFPSSEGKNFHDDIRAESSAINEQKVKLTKGETLDYPTSMASFLPHQDDSASLFSSAASNNEISSKEEYMRFIENFPYYNKKASDAVSSVSYHNNKPNNMSSKAHLSQKLRMLNEERQRKPPRVDGDYSVVKSFSYEIGPNGVKRLT